ncbi:hypothetical protein RB620_26185 [Paenibacillus sp. LHD-117]|uniref:hypothetical protein n=1 Tax=Paenibacillus sp. LHD-117 TaxID=3071412 RepID=UPI0027E1A96D|nr:hypothetical protein [Paenibacillus sp. LHD-117]MDQ6422922.1 hypothetical protein [Paenibacillus sp. LHD-117]
MNKNSLRKRTEWFIRMEIDRVIANLKNGVVNKEHALGSLNTLHQIASTMKDSDSMQHVCRVMDRVRNSAHTTGAFYFTEYRRESMWQ